jgi:hypothetical protein
MATVLEDLASGIVVTEFDGDTGIATVANVSGWLYENLGQVNTYLYTDFTGDLASGTYGVMDIEAQNVLKELYLSNYYNKQARNALRGIVDSSVSGDNVLSLIIYFNFKNKKTVVANAPRSFLQIRIRELT